ncbi:MAG: hypothetical protein ACOH2T_19195 [Pseudomonas sp.]
MCPRKERAAGHQWHAQLVANAAPTTQALLDPSVIKRVSEIRRNRQIGNYTRTAGIALLGACVGVSTLLGFVKFIA